MPDDNTGLRSFTKARARVLPVIILLDASASMREIIDNEGVEATGETVVADGREWNVVTGGSTKMDVTNSCLQKMIATFADQDRIDIQVGVITFGPGDIAKLHLSLQSTIGLDWTDVKSDGNTPMGSAFTMAMQFLEDKSVVPSEAYRPTLILISDGLPTDQGWEQALDQLTSGRRSGKANRMALAIGEADREMLKRFLGDRSEELFEADQAEDLIRFFEYATMSVDTRAKSVDPNVIPIRDEIMPPDEF